MDEGRFSVSFFNTKECKTFDNVYYDTFEDAFNDFEKRVLKLKKSGRKYKDVNVSIFEWDCFDDCEIKVSFDYHEYLESEE